MSNYSHAECPVCSTNSDIFRDPSYRGGACTYACEQCGRFTITDIASHELKNLNLDRGFVSGTIRRQLDSGIRVIIDSKEIERLAQTPPPTFKERMEGYLLEAVRQSPKLDDYYRYRSPRLVTASYSTSTNELVPIFNYLKEEGYLQEVNQIGTDQVMITARGRMAYDELKERRAASSQGFIAMWFDSSMEPARKDGLEVGIRSADYTPHRVDDKHHIDAIDDRIIAEIRRSRFVVADLTGHRAGVYYEAGFARGLEKPVFYTCREDEKDKIHFDIRQFNCIMWKEPAELATQLGDRIEAVIGQGPATK